MRIGQLSDDISGLANKQKNLGAERKFVRVGRKKPDLTKSSLVNASESVNVEGVGLKANQLRQAGKAPSLTETRQNTKGTPEEFMAAWDTLHPSYGKPTGGEGEAEHDPVRNAVREKIRSLLDENGQLPEKYRDNLKLKLAQAHAEGRALGPDDIGQDRFTSQPAPVKQSAELMPYLKNQAPGEFEQTGMIPAPLDPEQAAAETLAPDFHGNREQAMDWAQKASRSGWSLPFKGAGELVSHLTNPGGIDAVRQGLTSEVKAKIGRDLNEREMRQVEESVGGYLEQMGNLATSIVTGGATTAAEVANGASATGKTFGLFGRKAVESGAGAAKSIAGKVAADEILNAYPYAGHAVQTLLDPNATDADKQSAVMEGAMSALAGTHVGRKILGTAVKAPFKAARVVTEGLGGVGDKVRAHADSLPAKPVQTEIESPTFDREAFTKQLQSQKGPLEVGKGALPEQPNSADNTLYPIKSDGENTQGSHGQRIQSVDDPHGRTRFYESIRRASADHPHGKSVEVKPEQFYQDPSVKLFSSEDGLTGAAVTPDGDLVSVFRHPQSTGDAKSVIAEAANHASSLDAFDINGTLPNLYGQHGFRPVARVQFSDDHAPLGWNFERDGRPEIVLMVRDPEGRTSAPDLTGRNYSEVKDSVPLFTSADFEQAVHVQASAKAMVKESAPASTASTTAEPSTSSPVQTETPKSTLRIGRRSRAVPPEEGAKSAPKDVTEGISHADTAKERAANGLDPYVKTKYKVTEYSQEAIDRGHRDNALVIADEVNSGKKTSGDRWEQEGLRLAKHDANVARSQAQLDKGAAVDSGDAAAMLDASIRETTATANHDKISKALDKIGTEAGGTLGARALDLVSEGDALSLRKKIQSETGTNVSDADQARLDNHAKIVTELEKRVADLEAQASELAAKRAVSRGAPRSISRAGRVTNEQFKEAVKTLGTVVKTGQAGSGLGGVDIRWTDAHQEALRVVVRKIVQEGAATLEAVHAKVKETFGKEVDKGRVNQAIVDELGRPRDVPPEVLKERAKLNAEKRKTRQTVNQIISDAKWAQKTTAQKGLTHVADALSVPRRLMTFLDDSAIGRQGLFLGLTHPKAAGRAFKGHWEALKRDGFDSVMGRLENDPDFDLFKGTGGYFSDPRSGLHEEGFLNSTLDKIPGLKQAMAKSEDLMSAYLNELRLESFKALKGGLEIGGHKATAKELKWAADMVNVASGRGAQAFGGTLDKAAAQVFFSPQMLMSRLKMATGVPIAKGFAASPRAGRLATAEYAKYVLARGVLDTLLTGGVVSAVQAKQGVEEKRRFKGLGGKSTFDVHDKEFGQVRFGKLKTDVSGGQDASMAVVYKNAARLAENAVNFIQKKPLTKAPYGQGPVEDLAQFAGKRIAPVPSYIGGAGSGKDFKGDEFKPGWEALGLILPIHATSVAEAAHNEKAGWDAAKMLALEVFGFGTSYYEKKPQTVRVGRRSSERSRERT